MSFEDEYQGRSLEARGTSIKAFLPVMGFLLLIVLGVMAYFLSEPVHELLMDNLDGVPADQEVRYLVGAVLFVVMTMVVGMVYAAFAPKPSKTVTESQLKRERMMLDAEKKARRKRKQAANRKMAQARKQSERR
ncbi:hypothetical protein HC928_21480 [bacterium]|nr:hypothetical protein [bacterium]